MSGGSEVELPKPMPNKTMPRSMSGMLVPSARRKAREPSICAAYDADATSRRSAPSGIAQPTSVRPATASAVANPIATPACCAPSAGASRENRWATRPICANSPSAIPAARVRNLRSRHSSDPGRGFAAGETTDVGGAPGPSGVNPICCGVRENSVDASTHMMAAMTNAIAAAATGKPSIPIAATQSGEKITPPTLPPLYAIASAAGRPHEPGRYDPVDRDGAHRAPRRAAGEGGDEELPGCAGRGPADGAECERERAGFRCRRRAEAAVKGGEVRSRDGAREKMRGDGARDQRERPASSL